MAGWLILAVRELVSQQSLRPRPPASEQPSSSPGLGYANLKVPCALHLPFPAAFVGHYSHWLLEFYMYRTGLSRIWSPSAGLQRLSVCSPAENSCPTLCK